MIRFITTLVLVQLCSSLILAEDAKQAQEQFFETKVRPLLATHCFNCHNDKKQQGDLRLDRKVHVFKGNASGPIIVPGKLDESRLWQVVQYNELDTQMPPEGKLKDEEIQLLKTWIEQGAYWPEEAEEEVKAGLPKHADGSLDYQAISAQHWSYKPIELPAIPAAPEGQSLSNIDRFIVAKLAEKNLTLSPQASQHVLMRRISFDLLGVPPTYEEAQKFAANASPQAIEELIDRSLVSPRYGERWGRYWLDIARYADTKGYVFTENRFYPYSYTYRDYVIDSLNNDIPYDQFLMEQIAADQLGYSKNDPRLAALGFLTIGPRFLNREPDIIDDRIDVVTRGLMGMTVACARCHDHKYDPIPTADYYSLYGMFNSSTEPGDLPLIGEIDQQDPKYAAFYAELGKREKDRTDYSTSAHLDLLNKAKEQALDYLLAVAVDLGKVPKEVKFTHGPPRDRTKEYWKRFSLERVQEKEPILSLLSELLNTSPENLSEVIQKLEQEHSPEQALISAKLVEAKPQNHEEVVRVFGKVFEETVAAWNTLKAEKPESTQFDDPGVDAFRKLFDGPKSITDLPLNGDSPLFERDNRDELKKLESKISEWNVNSPDAPPRSMVLVDKDNPVEPHIFLRGTAGRNGDRVPRRLPHLLDPNPNSKFEKGSGRLEFAQKVVAADNPLTARVIVNRVWSYHFGTPLVATPSDFGLRGEVPSHPELLDYLAWSLIHEHGWSLKKLHKEIMLSSVYLQSSNDRPEGRQVDPANQLFWKQNRQRLDFEAMRDTMLAVSGRLDTTPGGRPVDLEKEPSPNRRSVYGLIDRNNVSSLLRTFDFPSPDSSSPGRPLTTVPQQALFAMNSNFAEEIAASLTERVEKSAAAPADIPAQLIQLAYTREPVSQELDLFSNYLKTHSLKELAQAVLMSNEFLFVD